jgi:hypothetical protein
MALAAPAFDWQKLRNPIYARAGWSVKDAAIAYRGGDIYLFFSAFFVDQGRERCHVSAVRTRDLLTFSEPLFIWSGRDRGLEGLCSPSVVRVGDTFVLTYNSWGDAEGQPNQLFYAISRTLERWDAHHSLAADITRSRRAIDAAVASHRDMTLLIWKEQQTPQMAVAPRIDGPRWRRLGSPALGWFENGQFLSIDGVWHLLATGEGHRPVLARMRAGPDDPDNWLRWERPTDLAIPRQAFNTHDVANAAFLADWREIDGHFYLVYAGNTEGESHAGRGDNRLGLARSTDLRTWTAATERAGFAPADASSSPPRQLRHRTIPWVRRFNARGHPYGPESPPVRDIVRQRVDASASTLMAVRSASRSRPGRASVRPGSPTR